MVLGLAAKPRTVTGLEWACQQLISSRQRNHSFPSSFPSASPTTLFGDRSERVEGLSSLPGPSSGSAASSPAGQAPGSESSGSGRMEVELAGCWAPSSRKPLVQWAAQLECYGGGRFAPHHAGSHPGKSCLKERRGAAEAGGDEAQQQQQQQQQQLEKLSPAAAKHGVATHFKPTGLITGVKRSRMAALR